MTAPKARKKIEVPPCRLLELRDIRDLFSRSWEKRKPEVPSDSYVQGYKAIPEIAQPLVKVVRSQQIFAPVLPAELVVGADRIAVDYGLCRPWRQPGPYLVLSLQR